MSVSPVELIPAAGPSWLLDDDGDDETTRAPLIVIALLRTVGARVPRDAMR